MDEQRTVAAFVEEHVLEAPPAYRVLDLTSEVGELAKEVNESTAYGATPADVDAAVDELGDALFALLALAESLEIDADDALEAALAKYRSRLEATGEPGSDE